MTIQEKNKTLQRRFIDEYQTGGNEAVMYEIVSENFINHSGAPGMPVDRSGVKIFHDMFRSAFPDLNVKVYDMIAEGDKVITRKSLNGTHKGDFFGIPPTNKKVEMNVIDIVIYKDGKLCEHWNSVDQAGLMRQLGVIK